MMKRLIFFLSLVFVLFMIFSCNGLLPGPDPDPDPDPDYDYTYETISQGVFISGALSIGETRNSQVSIGDRITIRTTANYSGLIEILNIDSILKVKLYLYCDEGELIINGEKKEWESHEKIDLDGDGIPDLMWNMLTRSSPVRSRNENLTSVLEFLHDEDSETGAGFMQLDETRGILMGKVIDNHFRLLSETTKYIVYEDGKPEYISFYKENLPDLEIGDAMIVNQWKNFFGRIRNIVIEDEYHTFFFEEEEVKKEEFFDYIFALYNPDLLTTMQNKTSFTNSDTAEEWDFDTEWDRINNKFEGVGERLVIRWGDDLDHSFYNDSFTLTAHASTLLAAQWIISYERSRFSVKNFKVGFGGELLFRILAEISLSASVDGDGPIGPAIPVPVPQPFAWLINLEADIQLFHNYNFGVEGNFEFGYEGHCGKHYFLVVYDRDNEECNFTEPNIEDVNVFRFRRIGPDYTLRGNAEYGINVHLRPTISTLSGWMRAGIGVGPGLKLSAETEVSHDKELEANFGIHFPLEWSADVRFFYGLVRFPLRGTFFTLDLFEARLKFPWRPENLNAQLVVSHPVLLEWESNSLVADGFHIQRKESDDWELIGQIDDASELSFSDTTVNMGTKYEYRARAFSNIEFQVFEHQIKGPDWNIPSFWSDTIEFTPTEEVTIRAQVIGDLTGLGPGQMRIQINDEIDTNTGIWSPVTERIAEIGDRVRVQARPLEPFFLNGLYESNILIIDEESKDNPGKMYYEFVVEDYDSRSFKAEFHERGAMILLDSGYFEMGNTRRDPEGTADEENIHTVYLTYQFYAGQFPVTYKEYMTYLDVPEERTDPTKANYPIDNVSWLDAISYCNWLSEKEGLAKAYDEHGNFLDVFGKPTEDITQVLGYRLLTEAEWEYLARGGQKNIIDYKYTGSNTIDDVAWYKENSDGSTHRIGRLTPNEMNIYDMSGNVFEWCYDWWSSPYEENHRIDPFESTKSEEKVIRGGGFMSDDNQCRVSAREKKDPDIGYNDVGFRIARTFEKQVFPYEIVIEAIPDCMGNVRMIIDEEIGTWGCKKSEEVYNFQSLRVEAEEVYDDWKFAGWYENDVLVHEDYTYTVQVEDSNRYIEALFKYSKDDDDDEYIVLEDSKNYIVKGEKGDFILFKYERPEYPEHSKTDKWDYLEVDIFIHNDGYDEDNALKPDFVENAEFYVSRSQFPTLINYDYRSGESKSDGVYAEKRIILYKVEPFEEIYIAVNGLDYFTVYIQVQTNWQQ